MRKTIPTVFVAMMLSAGFQMCFGDGPSLSITTSNKNVILTWSQTPTNWVLIETTGLDTYFVSNGVVYIEAHRKTIIPSANYGTNGTNYFVVLPIDYTANRFYMMQTNDFPPPPLPP
jgi:hypothetical protein